MRRYWFKVLKIVYRVMYLHFDARELSAKKTFKFHTPLKPIAVSISQGLNISIFKITVKKITDLKHTVFTTNNYGEIVDKNLMNNSYTRKYTISD